MGLSGATFARKSAYLSRIVIFLYMNSITTGKIMSRGK